jgi:hypothetical protein
MDEQVEQARVVEHPHDVRCLLRIEPLVQASALRQELGDDVARPDPALRADRLEDIAHLGIGARGTPDSLVDRCEAAIGVGDEARVARQETGRIRVRLDRQRRGPIRECDRFVVADEGDVVCGLEQRLLAADRRSGIGRLSIGRWSAFEP